jgi:hypothetical protein
MEKEKEYTLIIPQAFFAFSGEKPRKQYETGVTEVLRLLGIGFYR